MNDTMQPETVIEQEQQDLFEKTMESILAYGHDANTCELSQGVYLRQLQEIYQYKEPESTWKEFVAGYLPYSYSTVRRRILAAEWVDFGVNLSALRRVDTSRLAMYRQYADEGNWKEVLRDLLSDMSDSDMLAKWKGEEEAKPEPGEKEEKVVVKVVHIRCRECQHEDDYEVERGAQDAMLSSLCG